MELQVQLMLSDPIFVSPAIELHSVVFAVIATSVGKKRFSRAGCLLSTLFFLLFSDSGVI